MHRVYRLAYLIDHCFDADPTAYCQLQNPPCHGTVYQDSYRRVARVASPVSGLGSSAPCAPSLTSPFGAMMRAEIRTISRTPLMLVNAKVRLDGER